MSMPADMKDIIAHAALTLLMERHVKKLTVKEIVEECHITRQAFYYHFADISELFRWMLEQGTKELLDKVLSKGDPKEGLRCFFVMAIHLTPYIRRGLDSSHRPELEPMLRQYVQQLFTMAGESKNYYAHCSMAEVRVISRYHSLAILGLLQEWTQEDTDQLDQIVSTVYRLITEGIPPQAEA